jgi:hypothetical protein
MSSWASIVKKTPASASAPNSSKPVPSTPIPVPTSSAHLKCDNPVDYEWLQNSWEIDNDMYDRGQRDLDVEIQKGSRPDNIPLRRPDAATSLPTTFVTSEDYYTWICNEKGKNRAYSDELFTERMREWRTKMNWHLPPEKKSVTDQERRQGFYTAFQNCKNKNYKIKTINLNYFYFFFIFSYFFVFFGFRFNTRL